MLLALIPNRIICTFVCCPDTCFGWDFRASVGFTFTFSELSSFKISEQKTICSPVLPSKVCPRLELLRSLGE